MSELKQSSVALLEDAIDRKIRNAQKGRDTTLATVTRVDSDGTTWVRVYGGAEETPVRRMTSTASVGDVINVVFSGLSCMGVGNVSQPAATTKQVQKVASEAADQIAGVQSGLLQVERVVAKKVSADELEAEVATINQALINKATVTDLTAATGRITQLETDTADIDTIRANSAKVQNLTAAQLEADHATVGSLDANYAQVNLANVNNAWIENGIVKDAAITDAKILGVSANKLTAGTIDASNINVANLRADSLIVNKLNGQPVIGGYVAVDSNSSGYASKNPKTQGWYEISNGQMVATQDTTVNASKAYYTTSQSVALYDQNYIDGIETQLNQRIDGAIETYSGTVVPTLVNYPYTDWYDTTTSPVTDNRAEHVGDLYYVVNAAADEDGYCYRFYYDQTSQQYMWVLIKDSDVTAALGRIDDLEDFESTTSSWISETDEGLETIRTNHTTLSGRVDATVVESTQLWFTKADTTAPSKPTSQVTSTSTSGNAWRTVVPTYSSTYPYYYYCWQYKYSNGTYGWSAVIYDRATTEAESQARTGVANAATAQGAADAAQTTANANIKSSVMLWFSKANTTKPDKPTSQVTSTSTSGNAWRLVVPTYSSSYPYYYYCYQQQKGDGTYQWTDVVYDEATSTAMKKAQEALPASTFSTFETTTFKNVKDTVDEQTTDITTLQTITENNGLTSSTNITNTVNSVSQKADGNESKLSSLTTTLGTNADGTTKTGDIVHRTSAVEQDLSGITTRVTKTEMLSTHYATCSTAIGAAAKVATISPAVTGWTLYAGAVVTVRFEKGNSASTMTLDVNGTGAKSVVFANGTTSPGASAIAWETYTTATFMYDGTYWRYTGSSSEQKRIVSAETSITQTANSITSLVANNDMYTAPDGTTQTNTIKSAITQNTSDIALMATELTQMMALVPTKHDRTETDFWYATPHENFTRTDNGWMHFSYTNTRTSTNSVYIQPKNWGQVIPGEPYTFLLEFKNYSGVTGTGNAAYMQEMAGAQFWGGSVVSANGRDSTHTNIYADDFVDGAFSKRFVKLADVDHIGPSATYNGLCFRYRFYLPASATTSFDIRISVYPGNYAGPYSEYLSATSSAQLTVANDAISTKVEKDGVISSINQSAESVTIDANRVNIAGAAVFSNYSTTTQMNTAISNAVDGIEVGGRNLLTTLATNWEIKTFSESSAVGTSYSGIKSNSTTRICTKELIEVSGGSEYTFTIPDGYNFFITYFDQGGYMRKYKTWFSSSTFTLESGATHIGVLVRKSDNSAITTSDIVTLKAKIERGNKATDWTPAPEDIQATALDAEQLVYCQSDSVLNVPTAPSAWVTATGESVSDDDGTRPNLIRNADYIQASDYVLTRATVTDGVIRLTPTTSVAYVKAKVDYLDYADFDGTTLTASVEARLADVQSDYTGASINFYIGVNASSRLSNTFSSSYDRFSAAANFTNITSEWSKCSTVKAIPADLTAGKAEALVAGNYMTVQLAAGASTVPVDIRNVKLSLGGAITGPVWTTKRPTYRTTHPVTFVAVQRKRLDGTITCTTPIPDDSTTVIDGGHVITGTIDASRVNVINLDAASITSGTIDAGRIAAESITVEKLDGDTQSKFATYDEGMRAIAANADAISTLENTAQQFSVTQQKVTSHDDTLETITNRMSFEDGKLTLDASGGAADATKAVLTTSKLAFESQGAEVAYLSNQKLYVTNAQVLDTMQMGGFAWIPRSNGNLSLKWVGGVSHMNLLRGTGVIETSDYYLSKTTLVDGVLRITPTTSAGYAKPKVTYLLYGDYAGATLTFSFDARLANVESSYTGKFVRGYIGVNATTRLSSNFNSSYDMFTSEAYTDVASEWKRYAVTKTIPKDFTSGTEAALVATNYVTVQVAVTGSNKPVDVRNLKLEIGTEATPWSKNPND